MDTIILRLQDGAGHGTCWSDVLLTVVSASIFRRAASICQIHLLLDLLLHPSVLVDGEVSKPDGIQFSNRNLLLTNQTT